MSELSRRDWQSVCRNRIEEAELLLNHQKWSMGYYLSGLSIEMAMKAAIARQFKASCWPSRSLFKAGGGIYTHNINELAKHAGLSLQLQAERATKPRFDLYWKAVVDWDVESRYLEKTEAEARSMYEAVTNRRNGVLRWVRRHW